MEMKDLVQRIAYFRNKAKLSARELSLQIDKHGGYINKLESKDFNLSAAALLEIVDTLGIGVAEFFADNYATYQQDKELNDTFKGLSGDSKKTILDLMKNLK